MNHNIHREIRQINQLKDYTENQGVTLEILLCDRILQAVLGSDKTTFRFYLSNAARNAGTSTTVSGVLDGSAGVLIVPTNDDSVCLEESGGFMVVG